jgi:hypothetical protein
LYYGVWAAKIPAYGKVYVRLVIDVPWASISRTAMLQSRDSFLYLVVTWLAVILVFHWRTAVGLPSEDDPQYVWQLSSKEAGQHPKILGETDFSLEFNSLFASDDKNMENNDILANSLTYLIYKISPRLSFEAKPYIVVDGEDDGFRDYNGDYSEEGLYFKLLKLRYTTARYTLFGGRYEPAAHIFGYAPIFFGNYTTDLDLYGRIGIGASTKFSVKKGNVLRLTGHLFYLDTSRFSGEVFKNKLTNDISDGGVGNTEKFNNYLITLDGLAHVSPSSVRFTFGAGRQNKSKFEDDNEKILFTSLFNSIPRDNGAAIELSFDVLSLRNAGGLPEDNYSTTFGAGYSNWPFYLGAAYSRRLVRNNTNGERRTDQSIELVYRRGVSKLSYIESAYRWVRENNIEENEIGIAYTYSVDWLVF